MGPEEPKSATKPTRNLPLVGIDVFEYGCPFLRLGSVTLLSCSTVSIAAGQNTTCLLATPNQKLSDLPRHPFEVNPPPACVGCGKDNGEDDDPLECEKV